MTRPNAKPNPAEKPSSALSANQVLGDVIQEELSSQTNKKTILPNKAPKPIWSLIEGGLALCAHTRRIKHAFSYAKDIYGRLQQFVCTVGEKAILCQNGDIP